MGLIIYDFLNLVSLNKVPSKQVSVRGGVRQVALVGYSGSGKSTVIQLLLRLGPPGFGGAPGWRAGLVAGHQNRKHVLNNRVQARKSRS